MRLNELQPGESAIITGVDNSTSPSLKLMTLGVVEGTLVTCASKLYTSMEIVIHGSRLAVSNGTASHFICKRVNY